MKHYLIMFLLSAAPIFEIRGAVPYGLTNGIPVAETFFLSLLGNILVIPILLFIVEPLFNALKTLSKLREWINAYEKRAAKKLKHYRGYRLIGLFLLVAIPIPTTGVYTGVVAAKVLRIKDRNAFIAMSLGVVVAGVITYFVSYNIIELIK